METTMTTREAMELIEARLTENADLRATDSDAADDQWDALGDASRDAQELEKACEALARLDRERAEMKRAADDLAMRVQAHAKRLASAHCRHRPHSHGVAVLRRVA
jgi:hypothetical protein